MHPGDRPVLRALESIVVPDKEHGRVLVLRDTQGVTSANAIIPPVLAPIVSRFTGRSTCEEIARAVSKEVGSEVPVEVVVRLAGELDDALFLEGPGYQAAKARVERAFAESPLREASHAGGAYHGDRGALGGYIEKECLARANGARSSASTGSTMVGLIAPHIDPWRGAVGYGHAYGALSSAIAPDADTFVLFGTSHAPMREPFALCRKSFDTPFGPADADGEGIDAL